MNDAAHLTTTEETIRLIIRDELAKALRGHQKECPFTADGHAARLRVLEARFGALLALLTGSGALGGAAGALIAKLFA